MSLSLALSSREFVRVGNNYDRPMQLLYACHGASAAEDFITQRMEKSLQRPKSLSRFLLTPLTLRWP